MPISISSLGTVCQIYGPPNQVIVDWGFSVVNSFGVVNRFGWRTIAAKNTNAPPFTNNKFVYFCALI